MLSINLPDIFLNSLINALDDFKKIDLTKVLQHSLEYEQQMLLDKLAPTSITVPSGSTIKITYSPYGHDPILAVRLQELFGLLDTPKVNNGSQNVSSTCFLPATNPFKSIRSPQLLGKRLFRSPQRTETEVFKTFLA
jgi:ATP-dependent helicase HrpB